MEEFLPQSYPLSSTEAVATEGQSKTALFEKLAVENETIQTTYEELFTTNNLQVRIWCSGQGERLLLISPCRNLDASLSSKNNVPFFLVIWTSARSSSV